MIVSTFMADHGDTPTKGAAPGSSHQGVNKLARRSLALSSQQPQQQQPQQPQQQQPSPQSSSQPSSQQPPVVAATGSTPLCSDDDLLDVLPANVKDLLYLGSFWSPQQLREYRKLVSSSKGKDTLDSQVTPLWAHRIRFNIGLRAATTNVEACARNIASVVFWDSPVRHRIVDVLAAVQDDRLRRITERTSRLAELWIKVSNAAQFGMKVSKDQWNSMAVHFVSMARDRAEDIKATFTDGSLASREFVSKSSEQVSGLGTFLVQFFDLVDYESSKMALHEQAAFYNGRLLGLLSPAVQLVLDRVPYNAASDTHAQALQGIIGAALAHSGFPAGSSGLAPGWAGPPGGSGGWPALPTPPPAPQAVQPPLIPQPSKPASGGVGKPGAQPVLPPPAMPPPPALPPAAPRQDGRNLLSAGLSPPLLLASIVRCWTPQRLASKSYAVAASSGSRIFVGNVRVSSIRSFASARASTRTDNVFLSPGWATSSPRLPWPCGRL